MSSRDRRCLVVGNWKMYKTVAEAVQFVKELAPLIGQSKVGVYLAVPFTAIKSVTDQAKGTTITIGAQNMNDATPGAFTGEIAGIMIKEAGAQFVLLGHSERRHLFHETNAFINRKVKRAILDGLQPIVCVGETEKEREEGQTEEVIKKQLAETLQGMTKKEMGNLIIAYEPVWAIGTGKSATQAQAQEMHRFCRSCLEEIASPTIAKKTSILYGGSVKPDNAKLLMEQPDIDGLLVGGASLLLESFVKIVNDSVV